ncbi:MAG: divergent polysaccharide deacetylase family protein, partial [Aestuariivirga sp.]
MSDTLNTDLHKPLTGVSTIVRQRTWLPHVARGLAVVGVGTLVLAGLYAALVDDPRGGEPTAVARIEERKTVTPSPIAESQAQPVTPAPPATNRISATESEEQSGVSVVRPG